MGFKLEGLDKLQRDLEQVSKAFETEDGLLGTLKFNPRDPISVEAALAQVEQIVDEKAALYPGNAIFAGFAAQMKQKYQEKILDDVSAARISNEPSVDGTVSTLDELRRLEDVVADLRAATYQSFDRHIKKLSRVLHAEALAPFTEKLTKEVDVMSFLEAGRAAQSSMIGSALPKWPDRHEDELGLVIALIDGFAGDQIDVLGFSRTFYYTNGPTITTNLRHMVGQMIVPFARDYINHVKKESGATMSNDKAVDAKTYHQQFNFHNSSIGAVQTGNHSVANVTQNNSANQGATELLKALEVVVAALSKVETIPGHNKDEILELAEDGRAELAKEKPNITKLTSYLGAIGSALRVVANLGPAYATLKTAAAFVGIALP